jgi:hypothetical protein
MMGEGDQDRIKNPVVLFTLQHVQKDLGALLWKGSIRASELSEDVGSQATFHRAMVLAEMAGPIEDLTSAPPLQGYDRIPIGVFLVRLA